MGGVLTWTTEHWFDLLQTIGIVGGLLFSAYTTRKDEKSRRISNLIAVNNQYREIWKELYLRPDLSRVLDKDINLNKEPVSDAEELFINLLIQHLNTVYQATKAGMVVKFEGLRKDIAGFFSLPIPKSVWEKSKPFQDDAFVRFVEASRRLRN